MMDLSPVIPVVQLITKKPLHKAVSIYKKVISLTGNDLYY